MRVLKLFHREWQDTRDNIEVKIISLIFKTLLSASDFEWKNFMWSWSATRRASISSSGTIFDIYLVEYLGEFLEDFYLNHVYFVCSD